MGLSNNMTAEFRKICKILINLGKLTAREADDLWLAFADTNINTRCFTCFRVSKIFEVDGGMYFETKESKQPSMAYEAAWNKYDNLIVYNVRVMP